MKNKLLCLILAPLLLATQALALSPTNVQKGGDAGPNNLTGNLNIPTGITLTVNSGGALVLAAGSTFDPGVGTIAWAGISKTGSSLADLATRSATDISSGLLSPTYGGTGVNNASRTITIGGNFAMSGAFPFTGTVTGSTTVTFPTSGTLLATPGSTGITTLGTIITGTWNATAVTPAYGGSGLTTTTAYSPIFSGTTGTGTWKADTGPGTSGYVLTSNGAGAYPTWQAGGSANGVTAASPAAGSGLFWVTNGADRSAVATNTVATANLTTANVTTFIYGGVTFTGVTGTGKVVADTAPQIGSIELGNASDTTLSRSAAGILAVEGVVIPSISSTNTLTNKRVTARITTITSNATPTVNTDNCDVVSITAQAADITSMSTNFTGSPQPFDQLEYAITGTAARAITWNSSGSNFTAGPVALPTTTVTTKTLHVYFERNAANTTWLCMASSSDT